MPAAQPIKLINKVLFIVAILITAGFADPSRVSAVPRLNSQYYCVVDAQTGQYICGKNANVERPMASTTKIMTAILANEYAAQDEIATVSPNADHTPEYTIGLRAGQRLPVEELLKVALIRSANDAAVVLAEHIAGNEQFFAYLMSKKAFLIGAPNTRFQNASGLPAKNHYSTAYDLAQMSRYAVSKPYIRQLVGTVQTTFKHPAYQQPLTIRNTNAGLLAGYPGANGIKTGTTDDAGKCLVASAIRKDRELIAVALRSSDRQGDCIKLMDYGFQSTTRQEILDHEQPLKTLPVNNSDNAHVEVIPADDVWLWLGEDSDVIEKIVRLNYNLDAPIKNGQILGEIDIYINGRYFQSTALVSQGEVKRQAWIGMRLIHHWIESLKSRENKTETY